MSKQLAVSATFSAFAMAAFVLLGPHAQPAQVFETTWGATTHAAAPLRSSWQATLPINL